MTACNSDHGDSPVGQLTLAGQDDRLMHLRMVDQTYEPSHDGWDPDDASFPEAVEQLEAYFAGDRTEFDLDLHLVGTAFQRRVWAALLTIPYGETRSYGEIALQIGSPAALSRGRIGEWPQSDRHHRAVPSRHRVQRQPHRLRRWARRKRAVAQLEKSRVIAGVTLFDYRIDEATNACAPQSKLGGTGLNVCSAVSYFSARGGQYHWRWQA